MRSLGAACAFVVCSWIGLPPLAAQAPNPAPAGHSERARGEVLVVMESPGGVRAARSLRAALASQPGLRVMSLAEVTRDRRDPAVILTVAAVASREVSVAYWGQEGRRDSLSAPAPARADQLDAVVLALASALLERHRPELVAGRAAVRRGDTQLGLTTAALYAALSRYGRLHPRSNVALRFEDF